MFEIFFGENLDFPIIKILQTFVLMSEPTQKCENNDIFKQNYAQ